MTGVQTCALPISTGISGGLGTIGLVEGGLSNWIISVFTGEGSWRGFDLRTGEELNGDECFDRTASGTAALLSTTAMAGGVFVWVRGFFASPDLWFVATSIKRRTRPKRLCICSCCSHFSSRRKYGASQTRYHGAVPRMLSQC